jgi:hypothetical protein
MSMLKSAMNLVAKQAHICKHVSVRKVQELPDRHGYVLTGGLLCGFATVMEAAKEDDALLVHQHAVSGAGTGPTFAGKLLPDPALQVQAPQVSVLLELLLKPPRGAISLLCHPLRAG